MLIELERTDLQVVRVALYHLADHFARSGEDESPDEAPATKSERLRWLAEFIETEVRADVNREKEAALRHKAIALRPGTLRSWNLHVRKRDLAEAANKPPC